MANIAEEIIALTKGDSDIAMADLAQQCIDELIKAKGSGEADLQSIVDDTAAAQGVPSADLMAAVKQLASDQGINLADYTSSM